MEIFFVESGRFAPCAIFPKTKQCLRAPRTTSERRVSLKPRHMDFFLLKAQRICAQFFPICSLYLCRLDFIKKICYNIKKRHFFPEVKRSASDYSKTELQLSTVPQSLILQRGVLRRRCSKRKRKCGFGGWTLRRPGQRSEDLTFLKNYVIIELIP